MQKIGKRKAAPGTQNPEWLFPGAKKPSAVAAAPAKSKKSKAEKLAQELVKRRDSGESPKPAPPAELLALVSDNCGLVECKR